jgi:NitT/TauT family transport system substrate-binding protein
VLNKYLSKYALLAAPLMLVASLAHAEVSKLRIAIQYGITYLPLMIVQHDHLIEKNAKAAGLGDVTVQWNRFSGGNIMNEALLSGNLDLAVTGFPSFLILWDKGQTMLDVKGIASYGATPLFLVTKNPAVHTIKDFTTKDRIAVPAVKSSVQAIVLQMAAAQAFGQSGYDKLDPLTVSLSHAEAAVSMLSPNNPINAHFGSPPYSERELAQPGFHKVLESSDIFGGPFSNGIVYATTKFRNDNPKLMAAVSKSVNEALASIKQDPQAAAQKYLVISGEHTPVADIVTLINEPGADWSTSAPKGIFKFAQFMYQIKSIKRKADSWKDMFFPEVHQMDGS